MSLSIGFVRAAARVVGLTFGLAFASSASAQTLQPWMSPEVGAAWNSGYLGQGTSVTVIDDFGSGSTFSGNLSGQVQSLTHGQWTNLEINLVAPQAVTYRHDFTNNSAVTLQSGFNSLNLSYGMMAAAGYSTIGWSSRESSIIAYARDGKAVVAKAAGNDNVAIGRANASGQVDYLARDLIGRQSAIFVGALDRNGTTSNKANRASYSNIPGSNTTTQNQFLMVGVVGSRTGLYGTSFAAPIVAGYASILASKFTTATPTQVRNQLLNTARTDTINGYSRSIHGRGEASLTRALAPVAIK